MSKVKHATAVAALIKNDAIVAVNASSGLCCPDAVLEAIGKRYRNEGGHLTARLSPGCAC